MLRDCIQTHVIISVAMILISSQAISTSPSTTNRTAQKSDQSQCANGFYTTKTECWEACEPYCEHKSMYGWCRKRGYGSAPCYFSCQCIGSNNQIVENIQGKTAPVVENIQEKQAKVEDI